LSKFTFPLKSDAPFHPHTLSLSLSLFSVSLRWIAVQSNEHFLLSLKSIFFTTALLRYCSLKGIHKSMANRIIRSNWGSKIVCLTEFSAKAKNNPWVRHMSDNGYICALYAVGQSLGVARFPSFFHVDNELHGPKCRTPQNECHSWHQVEAPFNHQSECDDGAMCCWPCLTWQIYCIGTSEVVRVYLHVCRDQWPANLVVKHSVKLSGMCTAYDRMAMVFAF